MKKNLLFAVSIAVFALAFTNFVFAQNDKMVSAAGDMYVISAKAGGINYVEGKVAIVRKDGKSGLLLKSDTLEIGDRVSTGADGKAEILLNPGSFVRLGADTEFEFQTTALDDLKLKLSGGSAIFEVYADDEFKVSLDLPQTDLAITNSGVYRVDVLPDGSGKISVWKGEILIGADEEKVKSGRSAILKGDAVTVAKFDRDNKDEFDIWSDLRAKEASKINRRLQRKALSDSLLGSFNRGSWNMFGTFGLWVFDAFSGRWCFLPFGQGWRSPYGYGYGFNIYNCRLPDIVYNPPPVITVTPGNTRPPEQVATREERSRDARTPTFRRFENNRREERGGGMRNTNDGDTDTSGGWNNRDRRDSSETRTVNPTPTYVPPRSTPSDDRAPIRTVARPSKDNQ